MFHISKDSFFLLSLKHTEGEFSIISVPPSHTGHAAGTQQMHKAETEIHREGTRLLPLTTDLLLFITVTEPQPACLLQVYLSLVAKELRSLWAERSQTHSLLHGPSGSWHFPRLPHLETLSSLSVSQSSPIVAYFHCREKVKHQASEQWKSLEVKI